MKSPIFVSAGLVCVIAASNQSAHAVVLEQKWQTGKTLTYDTNLTGSVNLKIPASIPSPLAGIPLDVDVQGQGKMQLETLRVDEAGTGTVAVKVPSFSLDAQDQTFGVPANLTLRNGKSTVTVMGKVQDWGKALGERTVPKSAIKIGKDGSIKGFEPIGDKAPTAQNGDGAAKATADAAAQSTRITTLIVQALPALLPTKDVQQGDAWKAEVKYPAVARKNEQTGEALPLGTFDMTLKGQETVGGKSLWRIGVKGQVEVDQDKVNELSQKSPLAKGRGPLPQLESAAQSVEGDIWFDAQAGRIANADLVLGSNASTVFPGKPGKPGTPSWVDFTGTLQMKLAENA